MTQKSSEAKFSFRPDDRNYSVDFIGGPLDGEEIVTDECPNNDHFVHRFARREYLYRYRRTGPAHFRAEYDGLLVVGYAGQRKARSRYKIFVGLLVPTLLIVGVIFWYIL
jgi:hypothetical protein